MPKQPVAKEMYTLVLPSRLKKISRSHENDIHPNEYDYDIKMLAFELYGYGLPFALEVLGEVFRNSDADSRCMIVQILELLGTDAIPLIYSAMMNEDPRVRAEAVKSIGKFDINSFKQHGLLKTITYKLVDFTEDKHYAFSHMAYNSLGKIFREAFETHAMSKSFKKTVLNYLKLTSDSPTLNPADALRSLISNLPQPLEERAAFLAQIHSEYRRELIPLLEPIYNSRIQKCISGNLEEKRVIAKTINEEIKNYGMAIRCDIRDKTNDQESLKTYPGYLIADPSRGGDEIGRFRVEFAGVDGKLRRIVLPSVSDPISLMVAPTHHINSASLRDPNSFTARLTKPSPREI